MFGENPYLYQELTRDNVFSGNIIQFAETVSIGRENYIYPEQSFPFIRWASRQQRPWVIWCIPLWYCKLYNTSVSRPAPCGTKWHNILGYSHCNHLQNWFATSHSMFILCMLPNEPCNTSVSNKTPCWTKWYNILQYSHCNHSRVGMFIAVFSLTRWQVFGDPTPLYIS